MPLPTHSLSWYTLLPLRASLLLDPVDYLATQLKASRVPSPENGAAELLFYLSIMYLPSMAPSMQCPMPNAHFYPSRYRCDKR
jgi:hypothetical protein